LRRHVRGRHGFCGIVGDAGGNCGLAFFINITIANSIHSDRRVAPRLRLDPPLKSVEPLL
jgi:hypothetical protein